MHVVSYKGLSVIGMCIIHLPHPHCMGQSLAPYLVEVYQYPSLLVVWSDQH
jgi:hypothetical protein